MRCSRVLAAVLAALLCSLCVFSSGFQSETGRTSDSLFAQEEFRRGVQSYYRGAFNEAVLMFENALSYLPGESLILDWLAKAYYRAGLEGTALQHWQFASDAGYGGLLLSNKLEIIRERRVTGEPQIGSTRYVEAGSYPGLSGGQLIFSQPVSLLPNADGTCWAVAYGSNELLLIDVNGFVADRIRGPLNGFDRPMDIIRRPDGTLLVSEYSGDRISVLDSRGRYLRSFGSKGVGTGQMVGPQYLALDSSGNVYVTDFGNARVVVFDKDGNGLFSFGRRGADFPGFTAPTGIAVHNDTIYVADAATGAVHSFDRAGNYAGRLVPDRTFVRPEAMRLSGGHLIVSDSNRICTVDMATGRVSENARTGNAPSRVMCAVPDTNGNLLVSDFKSNDIYVMSRMNELVGGLFVQVERVNAENFPHVELEVKVENRQRQPVVGLKAENFYVTEDKRPVLDQALVGAASNNDVCDIALVVDRSPETAARSEAVEAAVREIAAAMGGRGTLSVVSAGEIPVAEFSGPPGGLGDFSQDALRAPVSAECATDLAVRLAANGLVNGEKKRAIVYITGGGPVSREAFSTYTLSQMSSYLNNNSIAFYTVSLSQGVLSEEVAFLTDSTRGGVSYVYRPEGLSGIVEDIVAMPNGTYRLEFTSSLPTDFGRAFLPLEVEAYLLNRSGRDETGYFPPLE